MSPSLPARALLGAIQLYKSTLSPLIGRECRYLPTCSSYAADCVRAHGAWAGSWMAAARVCRCHPFGGSGYDPAPAAKPNAAWFAPWRMGDWAWTRREPNTAVLPREGELSAKQTEGEEPPPPAAARPPPPHGEGRAHPPLTKSIP
ncbi:MAG: membrane protein insertion efficiency factor YidD [Alphaproteobacteria bacterium]|nr:membrane protein insertion efficiency factor YidD [Alphaproteobacteria bacterium]